MKITFFKPSKTVGGEQVLYSRLAQYIYRSGLAEVEYVDYKDGYVKNSLDGIPIIEYEEGSACEIDNTSCLIVPPPLLRRLNSLIGPDSNPRLLVWSLHPYNWLSVYVGAAALMRLDIEAAYKIANITAPIQTGRIRSLATYLSETGGLAFMDGANRHACRRIVNGNSDLIPVPGPLETGYSTGARLAVDDEYVNIAWIGRMVDFKVFPLIALLHNLRRYRPLRRKKVRLHIIGDGPLLDCRRLRKAALNQEVIWLGAMDPDELMAYLHFNIDGVISMGTSVLDSASLSLPSIIADCAYRPISPVRARYRWLYDSVEYMLGTHVTSQQNGVIGRDLGGMLDGIVDVRGKIYHGRLCQRHVTDNHSMPLIGAALVEAARTSGARLSKVRDHAALKQGLKSSIANNIRRLTLVRTN